MSRDDVRIMDISCGGDAGERIESVLSRQCRTVAVPATIADQPARTSVSPASRGGSHAPAAGAHTSGAQARDLARTIERIVRRATTATTWAPSTTRLTSTAGRQLTSSPRIRNIPTGRALRPKPPPEPFPSPAGPSPPPPPAPPRTAATATAVTPFFSYGSPKTRFTVSASRACVMTSSASIACPFLPCPACWGLRPGTRSCSTPSCARPASRWATGWVRCAIRYRRACRWASGRRSRSRVTVGDRHAAFRHAEQQGHLAVRVAAVPDHHGLVDPPDLPAQAPRQAHDRIIHGDLRLAHQPSALWAEHPGAVRALAVPKVHLRERQQVRCAHCERPAARPGRPRVAPHRHRCLLLLGEVEVVPDGHRMHHRLLGQGGGALQSER